MKKYKTTKGRKILYLSCSLIGIFLSGISILLAYYVRNDPLINYFIGFSSSLIITVIFAYFLEIITLQERNYNLIKKRRMYLLPIENHIRSLFNSCAICEYSRTGKAKYSFNDFTNLLKNSFESYCTYIDKIVFDNRNCDLLNKANSYKNGIQKYSVEQLMADIDNILDNRFNLVVDEVFDEKELSILMIFKKSAEHMKLPYLDTLSYDENTAHATVDIPKQPVNEIVKGNYDSAIKNFIENLKKLISEFRELKQIETMEYKIDFF